LASFGAALGLRLDGIGMDVQCCRSGEVVVIHDYRVDRTTNGTGLVRELTLAQLKRLDAGSHFDPGFAGETIPTLDEVLQAMGGKLLLDIEIKRRRASDSRVEEKVMGLLTKYDLVDSCVISSFSPFVLKRVKMIEPSIRTALLRVRGLPRFLSKRILTGDREPDGIFMHTRLARTRAIRKLKKLGYRTAVWGVVRRQQMVRLIALGVDAIITDYPEVLQQVIDTS